MSKTVNWYCFQPNEFDEGAQSTSTYISHVYRPGSVVHNILLHKMSDVAASGIFHARCIVNERLNAGYRDGDKLYLAKTFKARRRWCTSRTHLSDVGLWYDVSSYVIAQVAGRPKTPDEPRRENLLGSRLIWRTWCWYKLMDSFDCIVWRRL